jgi:hypothetical protein
LIASWIDRSLDGVPQADPHQVTLPAGHGVYVSYDTQHHIGEMFGAIGAIIDPATGSVVEHPADGQATVAAMKIVLPDARALPQIRPIGMPAGS